MAKEKKKKDLGELIKGPLTGANSVFSVNSPVDQLEQERATEPKSKDYKTFQRASERILSKLGPLLSARKNADKVYSNGYFQRHYPGAEKQIKTLLHEHVMDAWSHSLSDQDPPKKELGSVQPSPPVREIASDKSEKELGSGVTIHISFEK